MSRALTQIRCPMNLTEPNLMPMSRPLTGINFKRSPYNLTESLTTFDIYSITLQIRMNFINETQNLQGQEVKTEIGSVRYFVTVSDSKVERELWEGRTY